MRLLKNLVPLRIYLLAAVEVALLAACCVAAVYLVSPLDAFLYLQYEGGAERIAGVCATYFVVGYFFNFYHQIRARSKLILFIRLCQLIGVVLLVQAALAFINPVLIVPQQVLLVACALALILITAWRLFVRPAVWSAFGTQKVLIIGRSRASDELVAECRRNPTMGLQILGSIQVGDMPAAEPVLGGCADVRSVVGSAKPDRIVVAGGIRDRAVLALLLDYKGIGMTVETASQAYESVFDRVDSMALDPHAVLYRNELASHPSSVALQSVYNNVLGLMFIVAALPAILLVAIVLRLSRSGPVFSKIRCVGLHGVPFDLYRFDCSRKMALHRFLNRYKLASLPRAFNVVRGEVALIGPRAERVEFDELLTELMPVYRQRRNVKPGLMGWSQLHCDRQREEDTVARLEYDLYYIKHISLAIDAYIVIRAVRAALSDEPVNVPRVAISDFSR